MNPLLLKIRLMQPDLGKIWKLSKKIHPTTKQRKLNLNMNELLILHIPPTIMKAKRMLVECHTACIYFQKE